MPAFAMLLDYEKPCAGELDSVGVNPVQAASLCEYVLTNPVNVKGCIATLTTPTTGKTPENDTFVTKSEETAAQICVFLNGYGQLKRGTRNSCISSVMKYKTPEGHRAVSTGEFPVPP